MPEPVPTPRVMEVDCPSCGERLTTRADNAGKRIHCPVCNDMLTVPLRTSERLPDDPQLAVDSPRVFSPPPAAGELPPLPIGDDDEDDDEDDDDDDTYALAPREAPSAAPPPPPAAYQRAVAELDAEEAARRAERERFTFGPRREKAPAATERPPTAPRAVLGTTPLLPVAGATPDDYAIEPMPLPAERPAGEEPLAYRLAKERLEQEIAEQPDQLEEPPLWPFLSGVLVYPWSRPLLLPWATASVGAAAALLALQLASKGAAAGGVGMIAAVGCSIIFVVIGALTGSYLAVYVLSIVENTTAGLDELATAPDTTMMERIKPSGFLLFLMWVATLPGFALGYMLLQGVFGPFLGLVGPTLFVAFLMFPVMLLSTLDGGSIFQLLSPPIARGLRDHGRIWLGFYLSSGGALLVGLGASIGLFLIPIVGPLFAGPLLVPTAFVYARMIGRLSWLLAREEKEEEERAE